MKLRYAFILLATLCLATAPAFAQEVPTNGEADTETDSDAPPADPADGDTAGETGATSDTGVGRTGGGTAADPFGDTPEAPPADPVGDDATGEPSATSNTGVGRTGGGTAADPVGDAPAQGPADAADADADAASEPEPDSGN